MKRRIIVIILCLFLLLTGLFVGFIIESRTHNWEETRAAMSSPRNDSSAANWEPGFMPVSIPSPVDGAAQKAYFYKSTSASPQPLLVSLHSWSADYRQSDTLGWLSKEKNINYIHPDFRGPNWTKDACLSELVLSDIDAAIDYAIANGNVDTSKIYVTGRSGGGYATLACFMKSKHRIRKFSAWVPLTHLLTWYEETKIRKLAYADNILVCTHSIDGKLNREVAMQKSPFHWTVPVEKTTYAKLDIYAGVYDGLEGNGPIPITHSINFYNKLLRELNVRDSSAYISDAEKLNLLEWRRPLSDYGQISGRNICLTKSYGSIRITIFTGGHEMLNDYAFARLIE